MGRKLLDLPWELPLAEWPADSLRFRDLPIGPSRHLIGFLVLDLALGAPAPEDSASPDMTISLHIDWATGLDVPET